MNTILVLLLPFVVLAWAHSGRGTAARGRPQIMAWCAIFVGATWGGTWAALAVFSFVAVGLAWALGKHRLPAEIEPQPTESRISDFRGGKGIDALATEVDAVPLLAVTYPLWTATISLYVYRLSPGVYLSFERTTMQATRKDAVWLHSFLENGLWIESSDEIHLGFDSMPHECMRMRVCSDLGELVGYHNSNVARHGGRPRELSGEEFVAIRKKMHADRMRHGQALGMYRLDGGRYKYTARVWPVAVRFAFDVFAALRREHSIGPAESMKDRHDNSVPEAASPSVAPWERLATSGARPVDALLNVLLMLVGAAVLAQVIALVAR